MADKFRQWLYQNQIITHKRQHLHKKKQVSALLVTLIAQLEDLKKRSYLQKRYWVHPVLALRERYGFHNSIWPTVTSYDEECRCYMRMTYAQFQELLRKVGPLISKKHVVRVPIPAEARLSLTLRYIFYSFLLESHICYFYNLFHCRYLATGDCITSTKYSYLVGVTTALNIIHETCKVIWKVLKATEMPKRLSQEEWLGIAGDFEHQWDFPNCIGAIDGKHVTIQV